MMKGARSVSCFLKTPAAIGRLVFGAVGVPFASAHGGADALPDPLIPLMIAFLLAAAALAYSIFRGAEQLSAREKSACFWLVALPVMLASLYLVIHTLYDTTTSATRGPVHWHADYEVWVCGEKLDLVNPRFPKNKIGSPLLHEHNDDRIHIEGTVKALETISLGRYFAGIGGALSNDTLSYPATGGITTVSNGDACAGKESMLKVYVNGRRIENPESYLIYPAPLVPPGDCIIVQFDEHKEEVTDKVCVSWQAKDVTYKNLQRLPQTIGGMTWR